VRTTTAEGAVAKNARVCYTPSTDSSDEGRQSGRGCTRALSGSVGSDTQTSLSSSDMTTAVDLMYGVPVFDANEYRIVRITVDVWNRSSTSAT
jgi:hypothetical protein